MTRSEEVKNQNTATGQAENSRLESSRTPAACPDSAIDLPVENRKVFDAMPMPVGAFSYRDHKLTPVYFNQPFCRTFSYADAEEARKNIEEDFRQDVYQEDAARLFDHANRFANQNGDYDIYYRIRRPGQKEWHTIHAVGSRVSYGDKSFLIVFYMDETAALDQNSFRKVIENADQKQSIQDKINQKLEMENELHKNQYDDLTGLPNLGHFFQVVPGQIRQMREEGKKPAILWIEMIGLRDYNTMNGFKSGNSLLQGLGRLLWNIFHLENTARCSGERFVALTDQEKMDGEIRRLFEEVVHLNQDNSLPLKVGIYCYGEPSNAVPLETESPSAESPTEATPAADSPDSLDISDACDRARLAAGTLADQIHSDYVCFDMKMLEEAAIQTFVLQNFRKAMDQGWIQVYYQPVVRTLTGKLCGAEALARWSDPVHGMLSPGQFIPVFEDHGLTTDFDIYMAEQVCKDYKARADQGLSSVPVSINLSRKDFRHQDLVDRIEKLARKYSVPRENINIEITESAFVRHQERIRHYIKSFHELGYQVWMDDFGTAYSSLGSLKELNFDELKIDMSFLAQSSERARNIITSIVQMAKKIGIQTLAEGVETREQYDFLRRIGCEKIQGYYIGKPMDKETFKERIRELHLEEEQISWKNYYDAIGRTNFQTDQPLCLIEDDGENFRCLYINKAYTAELQKDGVDGIEPWLVEINDKSSPAHAVHRAYANEQLRKLSGIQSATYPSGDHYMELTGETIARYGRVYTYALQLHYISLDLKSRNQEKANYIQLLYYLCHDIAIIDLKESTISGIKSSNSSQPIGIGWQPIDLDSALKDYCDRFVYAPDHKRYWDFVNPATLKDRIRQAGGQILTTFLRSGKSDGEYSWLLHLLMPIPTTDFTRYLDVVLPADLTPAFLQELRNEDPTASSTNIDQPDAPEITDALLWRNQMAYGAERYFWKDKNRRFVGASRSFLDFYGFDSVDDIRGKNDEDMHWHVENNPFKNDELDVLEHGRTFFHIMGSCIAKGQEHKILASKMPIYQNGRIVGLMGKFIPAADMYNLADHTMQRSSLDPVTGLQNSRGAVESFRDYLEGLWSEDSLFSLIDITVPEVDAFKKTYGHDAGNRLLQAIADTLREKVGRETVIARLAGSYFAILVQTDDKDLLETMKQDLSDAIGRLRKVDQYSCALTAVIRITTFDHTNASQSRYAEALRQVIRYMVEED
ncbi:MAG: EAL domain-containing protein [Lachnospiraceae bacterium]|nr:EAL domain-containing protein [Lachnospiraceae bacterium]